MKIRSHFNEVLKWTIGHRQKWKQHLPRRDDNI